MQKMQRRVKGYFMGKITGCVGKKTLNFFKKIFLGPLMKVLWTSTFIFVTFSLQKRLFFMRHNLFESWEFGIYDGQGGFTNGKRKKITETYIKFLSFLRIKIPLGGVKAFL
jgi:hypothetical protein